MRTPRHPTLIVRMRQSRLGKLSDVGPLVGASLVQVNVRCGKPGCHCAEGEGHPSWYLSFSRKGKTVIVYVPKDDLEEVRQWVREHRRVKRLVREISELSVALLKAEARIRCEKRERKKKKRRRRRG